MSELHWAAGFFDGEGSIGVRGKPGYPKKFLWMRVVQVSREPLERFQKAVSGGRLYGPYENGHQGVSDWQCTRNSEIKRICNLLLPLVCEPKRIQITAALELAESNS